MPLDDTDTLVWVTSSRCPTAYEGGWLYDEALVWAGRQGFQLMRLIPGFTDSGTGQMMQADGVFFRR